jgi:hypothetical protein
VVAGENRVSLLLHKAFGIGNKILMKAGMSGSFFLLQ